VIPVTDDTGDDGDDTQYGGTEGEEPTTTIDEDDADAE
jgi:hypothetical protein